MSAILLVFSPRNPVTWLRVDTAKILRLLNFRTIYLVGLRDDVPVDLPKEVTLFKIPLCRVLNASVNSFLLRIFVFMLEQLSVALLVLKLSRKTNYVICSHCTMPLTMLLLRILKKNAITYAGGMSLPIHPGSIIARRMTSIMDDLCYKWSKGILAVSRSLLKMDPLLRKYVEKTYVAPCRFCDKAFFRKFNFSTPSRRKNIVGFVGRLSWEKGIMMFVKSIPHIASRRSDVSFLIVGDGPFKDQVLQEIIASKVQDRVVMIPWTNKVETYLKKMKLLVLPSMFEGYGAVVVEAMACGTLVLVTPIPALASLLEKGNTAFLLHSLNVKHLTQRVLEILERRDLDVVSTNAYRSLLDFCDENQIVSAWKHAFEAISPM